MRNATYLMTSTTPSRHSASQQTSNLRVRRMLQSSSRTWRSPKRPTSLVRHRPLSRPNRARLQRSSFRPIIQHQRRTAIVLRRVSVCKHSGSHCKCVQHAATRSYSALPCMLWNFHSAETIYVTHRNPHATDHVKNRSAPPLRAQNPDAAGTIPARMQLC